MNKKVFISGGGGLLLLGGVAFMIVGSAGVPEPIDTSKRGTKGYYTSDELAFDLAKIVTNLRGTNGEFIEILATAEYRVGPEIEPAEAPGLFSAKAAKLQDRFLMLISSKQRKDVESKEQKEILKQEMRALIQKVVFPDQKGMIEDILFRDFKIQ
ncbi:MAG: hypothetical protein CMJ83_02805 [Planctomycetes bacterium]|nr:hypothetical protein [Planctomycetota bacterium]